MAIMLLALYFYDRSRREILYLSLACVSLTGLRLNELCAAAYLPYSITTCYVIMLICNVTFSFAQVAFVFALAGRRISTTFRFLMGAVALAYVPSVIDLLFAGQRPASFDALSVALFRPYGLAVHSALVCSAFVAFWPYRRIAPRLRPLAALCMVWAAADLVWFAVELTALHIPGVPNLFARWGLVLLDVRAVVTVGVLAALLMLLFREQRQMTEERAAMAVELQAAGEIQRMLAPRTLDTAPGLRIDVAFRPMREVGGDFYLCRVLADGRQRVLVGDVSGKGTGAAMAAVLLIGGAAARDSDPPGGLLAHLNRVLLESRVGGFATCLCADVTPDGTMQVANAGHLSPYIDGVEIALDNNLPLGVDALATYQELTLNVRPGAQITLLTDGVVESRDAAGQMFGFERTAAISTRSAEEMAQTAQSFGQEDDITVLTLVRVG